MPNRRFLLATLAAAGVLAAVRPAYPADSVPPATAERLAEARTRLNLTPEQETQLRPLVEERNRRMLAIRDQYVPDSTGAGQWSGASRRALFADAKKIQKDYDEQVRAILNPDQEKEWEKMRREAIATLRAQHRSGAKPE
jgi:hypothetical protein